MVVDYEVLLHFSKNDSHIDVEDKTQADSVCVWVVSLNTNHAEGWDYHENIFEEYFPNTNKGLRRANELADDLSYKYQVGKEWY